MIKVGLDGTKICVFKYQVSYNDKFGNNDSIKFPKLFLAEQHKKLLELQNLTNVKITEIDVSDILWADGIDIGTTSTEEANRIIEMGEAAYTEMQNAPDQDDIIFDLAYRLSLIELGIN